MQIRPTTSRLPFSSVARVPCSFFLPTYTVASRHFVMNWPFILLQIARCLPIYPFATLQMAQPPPFFDLQRCKSCFCLHFTYLHCCKRIFCQSLSIWTVANGPLAIHLSICNVANGATASLLPTCIVANPNTSSTKELWTPTLGCFCLPTVLCWVTKPSPTPRLWVGSV